MNERLTAPNGVRLLPISRLVAAFRARFDVNLLVLFPRE